MHELPYEPTTQGGGDARRLARWLAAWMLVVFGLLGVSALITMGELALQYGVDDVLAGIADGEPVLIYAITGFSAPVAIAALAAWLMTGRVVVFLLASVPFAVAAGAVVSMFRYIAAVGPDWDLLGWVPLQAGYLLLGVMFLTRTFRRAVNAPRAGP